MRGGIPLSARVFALAAMLGDKTGAILPKAVRQAQNAINSRQYFHTAGTEQRKRRKANRRKLGGRRR